MYSARVRRHIAHYEKSNQKMMACVRLTCWTDLRPRLCCCPKTKMCLTRIVTFGFFNFQCIRGKQF